MEVAQVSAELLVDDSQFKASINNSKKATDDLKNHVERTKLKVPELEMPEANLGKTFLDAQGRLRDEQGKFVRKANQALYEVQDMDWKAYSDGARQAGEATRGISGGANEALAGVQKLTGLGTKAFTQLTLAATAVSAATGLVVKKSIDIGSGFESQMARVRAISGATSEEFKKLSERARELGGSLPITARDAASAMEVLAQRGTSVTNILSNVGDIVNLSISQQYGLAESADAVSATMLNFGMEANRAGEIVDAFNNASNQSALSMSSLGTALSYVAPNANALGMDLYKTVAAMEALADAGFSGSRIGTGLTAILTGLSSPTDKASAALSRLGVHVNDNMGKMRELKDIFSDLRDAGMSYADSVSIFGVIGARFGSVLAQNADKLGEYESGLKQSGSTAVNVAIQMDTLSNKWNAFSSSQEENYIKMFGQTEGQIKGIVDELTELSIATGAWIDRTNIAGRSVSKFFEGLGIGDGTIKSLSEHLDDVLATKIVLFFENSGKAIKGVMDAIDKLVSAVPWDLLIGNLDTVAESAFWMMILDKGVDIVGNVSDIAGSVSDVVTSFGDLSNGFMWLVDKTEEVTVALSNLPQLGRIAMGYAAFGGVLVGLGASMVAFVKQLHEFNKARLEVSRANRESKYSEQNIEYAEKYLRVMRGEIELLKELPMKYSELHEAQRQRGIDAEKLNIAETLKQEYGVGKITLEEYEESLANLEKAATTADYKNIQAAKAFANRYKEIMKDVKSGKLTKIEGNQMTVKLIAELDTSQISVAKIIKDIDKDLANDPVNLSRAFSISELKPRFEKELGEILPALEAKIEGAEREFGRGSMAFEAVTTEAFNAATDSANEFSDTLEREYGPAAMIALAKYVESLGEAGNTAFARIAQGMKGSKAEMAVFSEQFSTIKERIKYLGENPAEFRSGIDHLLEITPKLDEATGKVNEKYKMLLDLQKELNNTSLSAARTEVEALGKAVQAGLIDSKGLTERVTKKLLPEIDREIRASVNRDMAGATGKEKEAVYRERMMEEAKKSGIPELTKAIGEFLTKMPSLDHGYTTTITDTGSMKVEKLSDVWETTGSVVSSANTELKSLEKSSKGASDAVNMMTEVLGKTQPSAPGATPLRQIMDVDRQQGGSALVDMTAVTTAMQSLTTEATALVGKLDVHGGKIDAQTVAMNDLTSAITKQGASSPAEQPQGNSRGGVGVTIDIHDFEVKQDNAAADIARIVRQEIQKILRSPAMNGV